MRSILFVLITIPGALFAQQVPYDVCPPAVDLESGLASFIIEREGQVIATIPENPANPFGRPIFQGLQYSDTPPQPLVQMAFKDNHAEPGKSYQYRIMAVNTVGLKSP